MAKRIFSSPKTYSAAALVTVSDRNTFESQNIDYLASPPAAVLQSDYSGDLSIPEEIWTKLPLTLRVESGVVDSFDSDDGHASASGQLTVREGGLYFIQCQAAFEGASDEAGNWLSIWRVGQDGAPDEMLVRNTNQNEANFGSDTHVGMLVRLAEDDILEARVKHWGSGPRTIRNREFVAGAAGNVPPAEMGLIRIRRDDFT